MMQTISASLIALVLRHRYLVLYPVTVIEGPLITMAVGFAIQQHLMRVWIALPIIIFGDLSGDLFYYAIGRFGHHWRLTQKAIRYFKLEARKEKMTTQFKEHGGKLLLFGKLTHAAGAAFLVAAGYARMRVKPFLIYSFIGTLIKSSILMYVGYLAGAAYAEYARRFEWITAVITVISVGLVFALPLIGKKLFPEDPTGV